MSGAPDGVLVAGAGPVGLTAALALARRGVPVTVLEAEPDLPTDLRASTFHPPTLDMLEPFGLTRQIIADGLIAPTWQFRDREQGPVAVFDLGLIRNDTAHPYRVQCEQWKLTRMLARALADAGGELRFGHRVVEAGQDDGAAWVVAERDGATARLQGTHVIAADGARSAVRKSTGIAFEGFTYPELFLVVSTPFEFADHLPGMSYINYISDPSEWFVLLRVRELWRVLFPVAADAPEAEMLADAAIAARLQGIVARPEPYEVAHRTLYHVHQRVAASYRSGRIFLAGDAAHINNPLGGMGMNGGIHDALALAEALADGTEAALARYERRRRPVAVDYVQQATMRNRQLLAERDPEVRRRALDELRRIAEDPERAYQFLLRSSMIASLREADRQ